MAVHYPMTVLDPKTGARQKLTAPNRLMYRVAMRALLRNGLKVIPDRAIPKQVLVDRSYVSR